MSARLAETVLVGLAYVALVSAGVLMGEAALAGFAVLTILPLALLFGLRRQLSIKQKLATVGLFWYAMPIIGLAVWVSLYPGRPIYFVVASVCVLIFFICFAWLINAYWIQRG
jgi:hypothetical protein